MNTQRIFTTMKRLVFLFALLLACACNAQSYVTVWWSTSNSIGGVALTNNNLVQQVTNTPQNVSTYFAISPPVTMTTSNGFFTNTFAPGAYKVTVQPDSLSQQGWKQPTPILFFVPSYTNGGTNLYSINQLTNNAPSTSYPTLVTSVSGLTGPVIIVGSGVSTNGQTLTISGGTNSGGGSATNAVSSLNGLSNAVSVIITNLGGSAGVTEVLLTNGQFLIISNSFTNVAQLSALAATNTVLLAAIQAATNTIAAASLTGTLTNSTTGNASTATMASAVQGSLTNPIPATNLTGTINVTNLPSAAVTNTQTNVTLSGVFSANTLYQDTNSIYFANLAGITNLAARQGLVNFQNEINAGGINSNLVDAVFLQTWLNPQKKLSYKNRPFVTTNVVQDSRGAIFGGTSTLALDWLPNCRTNTILFVWRFPRASGGTGTASQQFLGGLVNTNTSSADWYCVYEGQWDEVVQRSGTSSQWGVSGYGGLIDYPLWTGVWDYVNLGINQRQGERMVTAISCDGNGNVTAWTDGIAAKIGLSVQNFSTNSTITNTDILTELRLGTDIVSAGGDANLNAEIYCAVVLNCYASPDLVGSNIIRTVTRAVECLEPEYISTTYIGDSTFNQINAALGGVFLLTNSLPYFIEQNLCPGALNWHGYGIGGSFLSQQAATSASNFLFSVGHAPSVRAQLVLGSGINDLYQNSASAATCLGYVSNISSECTANGVSFFYLPPRMVGISNTVAILAYSVPVETQRTNLLNMCLTNRFLFSGGLHFGPWYVTQNMLNTNLNTFSLDGVHFQGALGWLADELEANVGWTMPAVDFDGNNTSHSFVGNGAALTGVTAMSLNMQGYVQGIVDVSNTFGTAGQILVNDGTNGLAYWSTPSAGGSGTNTYAVLTNSGDINAGGNMLARSNLTAKTIIATNNTGTSDVLIYRNAGLGDYEVDGWFFGGVNQWQQKAWLTNFQVLNFQNGNEYDLNSNGTFSVDGEAIANTSGLTGSAANLTSIPSNSFNGLIPATNLTGTVSTNVLPISVVTSNGVSRPDNSTIIINASGQLGLNVQSSNFFAGNGGNYSTTNLGTQQLSSTATFNGNGSGVTNLNASSLASGTIPITVVPTNYLTNAWNQTNTYTGTSNIINLSTYSNAANLGLVIVSSNYVTNDFTNIPSGVGAFQVRWVQGPGLTNNRAYFTNQTYTGILVVPAVYGQFISIPTNSTNSDILDTFTVDWFGTNQVLTLRSQIPTVR